MCRTDTDFVHPKNAPCKNAIYSNKKFTVFFRLEVESWKTFGFRAIHSVPI